ncbi:toprim domain-containing protein [Bradyrhizobium sp. 18BD]
MNLTLDELAHRLGGDVHGLNVLAPGPGHSAADRSLSILIDPTAPDGFIVHSFAGDPPMECRDYVRSAIGVRGGQLTRRPHLSKSLYSRKLNRDADRRSAVALKLWNEACDPRGTVVTTYLAARGLTISDDIANEVIRFHPTLKTKVGSAGGMLALLRDNHSNEPCGIHRTFLDETGRKLGRKMLGRARGAAIKLDADEHVTLGLHIGEGIESALAARLAGFRPVWAFGSSNAISAFPVLTGIETITILGEVDDAGANYRAATACAKRWTDAGRETLVVWPQVGGDLNDVWQEAIR